MPRAKGTPNRNSALLQAFDRKAEEWKQAAKAARKQALIDAAGRRKAERQAATEARREQAALAEQQERAKRKALRLAAAEDKKQSALDAKQARLQAIAERKARRERNMCKIKEVNKRWASYGRRST